MKTNSTISQNLTLLGIASVALSLVSCDGKKVPLTENDRGYNEGIRETREAQNETGIFGAGTQELKATLGVGKDGESADYNSGYREGIKDELEKTYPTK